MDFAWSVAHPFVLNPGAPTGYTVKNILLECAGMQGVQFYT